MIIEREPGEWWYFAVATRHWYGPYVSEEAAGRCEAQYTAFVASAPDCHHW